MDTNTLVNRFEILFYSLLISLMSGINRLRSRILPTPAVPIQQSGVKVPELVVADEPVQPREHTISWKSIQEIFAPLLLWAILGFAAGFLIGMIKPW
jgi:hypothetical protein